KVAIELELREERLREASAHGDCNTVQTRKALYFACAGEHNDCVKLLIEHGANVNMEADIAGNRPLHLAVISNKMDCVIALLETVARSRLNILMKNIESANVDVEEIVKDNEHIPENQKTFVQVLGFTGNIILLAMTICIYFDSKL
ncbi:24198_t:CDS:2, partial [Gigaspora rosea]